MAVRKRGSGWFADVYLPNGERVRKTASTKREAEALERQLVSDAVVGNTHVKPVNDPLFHEFMPTYLQWSQANKSANTYRNEDNKVARRLIPFFGKVRLSQIDAHMIERYKFKRQADGVSPRTVNIEITLLSVIYKMAIKWGYARQNPVNGVEKLKQPQRSPRFLSSEEIARLLKAAKGRYIFPFIVTALHTGMRKSELLNLQWEDIDFPNNTITVQSKADWHTKNYDFRAIEMTATLRNVLQAMERENEYVFTYHGKRIVSDVKRSVARLFREAGIENASLHTLRHTFASHLAMQGVPLLHIQQLLGHLDYDTTLVYAHLSKESFRGQVHKLPFDPPEES